VRIRKSAAFGEIIILIVYLPILALVGIEGKMFRPMAETVSFAILGALILSLTYVPMMSALVLSRKTVHKRNISDKIMDYFHQVYTPVINYALTNRILIVVISTIMLIITFFLFANMGGEFIPTLEEGDFAVETRILPGSSLTQTVETMEKASGILLKNFPEVKEVVGKIGSSEIPTDPMPIESGDLIVVLKDKEEWTSAHSREELANKMSEALSVLPGVEFGFQQPIQMRFNELMTGARQDLAIKIFGDDLDLLADKAQELSNIINGTPGIGDIYLERVTGLPQIMVEYNRDKIAQYGLSVDELNRILRTSFAGEKAGIVFEGEKRFDLVLRLQEDLRQNISDVKALYVPLPSGDQIPITEVANIQFKEGPMQISREMTKRRIVVGVNVRDRDVQSLVEEIKQKLNAKLKLPPGYYISYGGQFENLVEAKQRLTFAVPAALGLILILLFITFDSFKETLLIFTAIPFSAIGGVVALLIRDMPFSISAGVGFIALFGVAVLNGIVLIGYFNQLKHDGITDIRERVLTGTSVRLRPVLMTATVASLGFLPMALSGSAGAEVQKPLATVVIGGLISATLLTLIVLPVLYTLFYKNEEDNSNKSSSVVHPVIIVILLLTGLLATNEAKAQGQIIQRNITLDQALNESYSNNLGIQTVEYETQSLQAFKRTSLDLTKTNISLLYGQYNSIYKDNNFTVTQYFFFPTVYSNQAKLAQANVIGSERKMDAAKNELKRGVSEAYYNLLFFDAKKRLLLSQDSLFTGFMRASEIRLKTGESNMLEKVTAETQALEVKNMLIQNESDIIIWQKKLQTLLNTKDNLFVTDSIRRIEFLVPDDSVVLSQNPYLSYLKQQVEIGQRTVSLERSRAMPDFNIGYFNQSLRGVQNINGSDRYFGTNYRFQGIQAGISVPLWYRPFHARVNVAKLNQKAAETNLGHYRKNLEGEFAVLLQEYIKYKRSLDYYEKSALPHAQIIIKNAEKGFHSGEIGYVEYLQGLTRALSIQTSYLTTLNLYNQTIISIEFILGGK
jgi:cobalt-zinc-cadmium resistance protein CzcA